MVRFPQPVLGMLYAVAALSFVGAIYFAATHGKVAPAMNQAEALPFAMEIPEGWTQTTFDGEERVDGVRTYVSIEGKAEISVRDVLKEGRTFEETAAVFVWDETDVDAIVALMKDEAGELFPDFSKEDIRVSLANDTVGGMTAVHASLQCLKPCYVEGGAATTVRYLVDAPDHVYIIEVGTETAPNTTDVLNEVDAIVRTFRAR